MVLLLCRLPLIGASRLRKGVHYIHVAAAKYAFQKGSDPAMLLACVGRWLPPLRGRNSRWLGVVAGKHEHHNSLEQLACMLGRKLRPDSIFLKKLTSTTITICAIVGLVTTLESVSPYQSLLHTVHSPSS